MTFKDAVRNAKYKSDEAYRAMVNSAIADCIEAGACFYGYMYGAPYYIIYRPAGIGKDRIIMWENNVGRKDICVIEERTAMFTIWGEPGSDYNVYYFCDYGITWAFNKDEIDKLSYDEWMAYQKKKELSTS